MRSDAGSCAKALAPIEVALMRVDHSSYAGQDIPGRETES